MKSPKPRMRAGKIGDAVKSGAKKVVEGYLKGTQKLADKIQSVLPEVEYDRSGRGGRGRRRPGGRQNLAFITKATPSVAFVCILNKEREEKMFNDQNDLFETVQCAVCGETIPRLNAFIVEKHTAGEDIEIPFCNEAEANEFYLEKLRTAGI